MTIRLLTTKVTRLIVALFTLANLLMIPVADAGKEKNFPAPEFTHDETANWLNSPPLSIKDLRGKVILFDFWTFDCWNCTRSIPWLKELEAQFSDKALAVIGIHTPEFQHERKLSLVQDKVKFFGLNHPIMLDNDFSYWNALGTSYWPTFYLIDKKGQVRYAYIGETHMGDKNAGDIERMINQLLAE